MELYASRIVVMVDCRFLEDLVQKILVVKIYCSVLVVNYGGQRCLFCPDCGLYAFLEFLTWWSYLFGSLLVLVFSVAFYGHFFSIFLGLLGYGHFYDGSLLCFIVVSF